MTAFPEVGVFSVHDALEQVDKLAHKHFGTNGSDLMLRYDDGEYRDEDSRRVAELEMLLPFAR